MQLTPLSGKEIIAYGLKLKLIKVLIHVLGDIMPLLIISGAVNYFRNNHPARIFWPSLIGAWLNIMVLIRRGDLLMSFVHLYPFLK